MSWEVSSYRRIPPDTTIIELLSVEDFLLRAVGRSVVHYSAGLRREGYTNTFALGFVADTDELVYSIAMQHDDAALVEMALRGPRALVSRWTPYLYQIPLSTPLQTWLTRLPVNLSPLTSYLEELGFDSPSVLRHIHEEDLKDARIPTGYLRVLLHCARCIRHIQQDPPEPTGLSIGEWLALLNPPLDQYSRAVQLHPRVKSVLDLLLLSWRDVSTMVMRRGHQRLLWHYIVAARVKWYDPV